MQEDEKVENKKEDIKEALNENSHDKTDEYLNRLKYLQAEFDNYRKYVEKMQKHSQDIANEALVIDLLPVLDDFEASLKNIKDEKTKEGIQMLFNNFLKALGKHGLKEINIEEKFNPYYHEVILQEESKENEGKILEVLQKGYMLNSKVIRHTKVKVSKGNGMLSD